MASQAQQQPIDALGYQVLSQMYKDLKDNRNVPATLIELISQKVENGLACDIDSFMLAVSSAESLVIRFYRKLIKLMPNRFLKTELLQVDMRSNISVKRYLQDFLLWNQGLPVNDPAVIPVARSSNNIVIHPNGKLTTGPVKSGPLAPRVTNSDVRQSPAAILAQPPPPMVKHVESSNSMSKHSVSIVKIQPSQLWKNSSLPASSDTVLSVQPLTHIDEVSPTNGSSSTTFKKLGWESINRQLETANDEIIDLLLDDDETSLDRSRYDIDNFSSGSPDVVEVQLSSSSSSTMASTASSSMFQKSKYDQEHSAAAARPVSVMAPPTKVQVSAPAPVAPKRQHKKPKHSTNAQSASASAQAPRVAQVYQQPQQTNQAHDAVYSQYAKHFAAKYQVDETYCLKALRDMGGNGLRAEQVIQQYAVDLAEAKMMDKARLDSENTAVLDKKRAARDREAKLATPEALNEFADSELLIRTDVVRTFLSRNESALTSDGAALRRALVKLLDEEKKAIKWYKDYARAYMRTVASRVPLSGRIEFFQNELNSLKEILYATASESGTPLPFLAARDGEMTQNIQPGQVLGRSADAPVEVL